MLDGNREVVNKGTKLGLKCPNCTYTPMRDELALSFLEKQVNVYDGHEEKEKRVSLSIPCPQCKTSLGYWAVIPLEPYLGRVRELYDVSSMLKLPNTSENQNSF
jgi:hypothetical protein